MKVFAVMRRRDDLPSMTLPLAVLLTAVIVVFTAVGGRLASSELVGSVAALPFVTGAACLYALIILLWRKLAAFLVTPLSFAVLLASGSSRFAAVTITLSLLFVSYVYAVSLISRESKFQRLLSLSVSAAICILLTITAWAGFHAASYDAFVTFCMDGLSSLLAGAYGLAPSESYVRESARNFLVMTPAYLAILSLSLAWLTEVLTKSMFRLLGCTDLFIGITHRITLPVSYAVIYAAAFLLSMLTIPEESPLISLLLNSTVTAMMLPCASVGVSMILRKIRVRMYYASQKRALTTMLMVMAFAAMGIINAIMILSVAGAYFVIADFLRKRKKQRKKEHREWE